MPYTKEIFVDGDVLTAEKLNHIEDGVDYATKTAESAKDYVYHPPIIGENGNWLEWDGTDYVDSGNSSRGEQGIQGPRGEQGIQGKKGDNSVVVVAVVENDVLQLSEVGSSEIVAKVENDILHVNKEIKV